MDTPADILRRAKARIEDPEHWTTHVYATDREGKTCDPRDPWAFCWCAYGTLDAERRPPGAFISVGPTPEWTVAELALIDAARTFPDARRTGDVAVVNDKLGHAAVMRLYERAIKIAEEGPND